MSARDERIATTAAALRHSFDAAFAAPTTAVTASSEDVLAIRLGAEPYALRLSEIAGLHTNYKLVEVPGPLAELLGLTGIRGLLVPVYDLAALLGYPRAAQLRWLVLAWSSHAAADPSPVALAFTEYEAHLRLPRTAFAEVDPTARGATRHVAAAKGSVQAAGILRPLICVGAVLATIEERTRGPSVITGGASR